MKRFAIALIAFSVVFSWTLAASARHDWRGDDQPYDRGGHWQHHSHYRHEHGALPFAWHDRYRQFHWRHHLERVHDREMLHHFPGLHAYRWHGDNGYHHGFWHDGHYVRNAILFFDEDDELVSFGYMANGVFVYVRDDNEVYRNHDRFFISWWHRH